MRRRDVIAGAAALATVGGGAAVAIGGWNPLVDDEAIPEFELESIAPAGSDGEPVAVPERGTVTFLELFATWCGVCENLMGPLSEAHAAVGDDVQFVSVTNEPIGRTVTAADVADWWASHGGTWTVAHDADLDLTGALEATSVPYSLVLDERNHVTWRDTGYKSTDELLEPIDAALADGSG